MRHSISGTLSLRYWNKWNVAKRSGIGVLKPTMSIQAGIIVKNLSICQKPLNAEQSNSSIKSSQQP